MNINMAQAPKPKKGETPSGHRLKEISTMNINMKAPKPKKETPSLEPMRDQHRPKEISTIDINMKAPKPKKETPSLKPMRDQHRPKAISTMNINMKAPKPKESSQPRSLVCQKCVNNIYSNDMNRHHQREREKATIEEKRQQKRQTYGTIFIAPDSTHPK